MGRDYIMAARINSLKIFQISRISGDERPAIYLDEAWVKQYH
jgi:hypothetical protein